MLASSRAAPVLGSFLSANGAASPTAEFENEAVRMRQQGKHGFFISIERLAESALNSAIEPTLLKTLHDWADGETEGTFFLDAVDDAKLFHHDALERALRNLRTDLAEKWERVRLVLSCRVYFF